MAAPLTMVASSHFVSHRPRTCPDSLLQANIFSISSAFKPHSPLHWMVRISQVATIFVQDRSLVDESCLHFHHSKRQHHWSSMPDLGVPDWLCLGTPFAISVLGLPIEHRLTNTRAHRARPKVKGSSKLLTLAATFPGLWQSR